MLRTWRTAFWHFRHGGPSQVRKWRQRRRAEGIRDIRTEPPRQRDRFDPMDMPVYVPNERPRPFEGLRVAVIMDDFSLQAWHHEFSTIVVTPDAWRQDIYAGIDLLFVESAWSGNDGAWQYQLTGSSAPSEPLRELVKYCRDQGIPSVFWNKEDPPHFEDFLDTAKLFDHVMTSDSNLVDRYRKELGHDRVTPMSFAAQPAIHNPIRTPGLHQRGDIAFAGMYFRHKFPERRAQMDILLGAAEDASAKMKSGLTIYSRFVGGDERYQFPAPFADHVVGGLPYSKMLSAYRAFKVFLNVNSVIDSPSMCARRIFEITASGTPVVSTPSAAVPSFFAPQEVPTVQTRDDAAFMLRSLVNSKQMRDRMVHRAQRRIWGAHTYTHRALQILETAGIEVTDRPATRPKISVVCSTNRPAHLLHLVQQVGGQADVEVQLVLVAHGFDADNRRIRHDAAEAGISELIVTSAPVEWSLGECLNAAVERADGEVVAKFDDDDIYGEYYLLDQVNALRFSGADLVGKQASYAYLTRQEAIVLRNPEREHRWTSFVAGPTFVAPAATFKAAQFPAVTRGEDTEMLAGLTRDGARIYSADRFNFVQIRGAGRHTWTVDDNELLANGVVETYGPNFTHAMVGRGGPRARSTNV